MPRMRPAVVALDHRGSAPLDLRPDTARVQPGAEVGPQASGGVMAGASLPANSGQWQDSGQGPGSGTRGHTDSQPGAVDEHRPPTKKKKPSTSKNRAANRLAPRGALEVTLCLYDFPILGVQLSLPPFNKDSCLIYNTGTNTSLVLSDPGTRGFLGCNSCIIAHFRERTSGLIICTCIPCPTLSLSPSLLGLVWKPTLRLLFISHWLLSVSCMPGTYSAFVVYKSLASECFLHAWGMLLAVCACATDVAFGCVCLCS